MKLFIYPFTSQQLPFERYYKKFRNDINVFPVVPEALFVDQMDVSYLANGDEKMQEPINIDHAIEIAENDDVFCFSNGNNDIHCLKYGIDTTRYITKSGHTVSFALNRKNISKIQKLSDSSSFIEDYLIDDFKYSLCSSKIMHNIKIPVIAINSIIEDSSRFDVCLNLMDYYKKCNLNVECIVSDNLYNYLGITTIDYDNMIINGIDNMVLFLYNIFNELQEERKSDLIICDIPGGILRYDDSHVMSSGVYAYILSQAVRIKTIICCVPFSNYNDKYYKYLSTYINNRFGVANTVFHMTNYIVDNKKTKNSIEKIAGRYVSYNYYLNHICYNKSVHNLLDTDSNKELLDMLL